MPLLIKNMNLFCEELSIENITSIEKKTVNEIAFQEEVGLNNVFFIYKELFFQKLLPIL